MLTIYKMKPELRALLLQNQSSRLTTCRILSREPSTRLISAVISSASEPVVRQMDKKGSSKIVTTYRLRMTMETRKGLKKANHRAVLDLMLTSDNNLTSMETTSREVGLSVDAGIPSARVGRGRLRSRCRCLATLGAPSSRAY